jgi:hypothetical protein
MMYQIVWMRRLALVFGSTALATSATLVALLGGLAIGGWIWGRVADRRPQSILIVLAAVQIATGFYGFASLWIFRGVQALYLAAYPLLSGQALSGRAVAGHASLFAGAQLLLNALAMWAAGGGSVATLEFYRTVGARLKPGGVFAQRIDTHALAPEDFDLLAATFHAVFPHMQVWTSAPGNIILLGSRDSLTWDYGRLAQQFTETQGVAADLESAGIWHPFALFGAQVLGETESDALARDIGELHTDNRRVLEFRTPRFLYVETTPMIVHALDYYRRPDPPAIAGFDPEHDLDADSTYLLGFAYASVGWPELAITYMKRSTAMAPNRAVFLVGLGNQYRAAGRIQDADAAFERALTLDLNNLEALLSLGEIRFDEGQLEWTRVLADRALQLAPQDARVHALIGKLLNAER